MHLAIDACNIRQGGGLTHLTQLLSAAEPSEAGFSRVTVWASRATLEQLPSKPWLTKVCPAWIDAGLLRRFLGQQFLLGPDVSRRGCDVLFSPGGTVPTRSQVPTVTMSQNMLPFEPDEAVRFGRWSWMRLKMWLLRQSQGRSFKNADGLIFLTRYACETVCSWLGGLHGMQALIPHGIEPRFAVAAKHQRAPEDYSFEQPFTFLYVSILMPYKHQIEVAKAVHTLRHEGCPVRAIFVGEDWGLYGQEFRKTICHLDPKSEFLVWKGGLPFSVLHQEYQDADAFIFASTCENLPNILIEAMTAGLPIACSNRGPMPEVLKSAGIYFDPLQQQEIVQAMRTLINSADLRSNLAIQVKELAQPYSWHRCAKDTFEFIAKVGVSSRVTN
jgi:glycosyltransferase involved in cell wall biosynthesis